MKWAALAVVVLAAALASTAFAAKGDPQKRITKAGQARARAASIRLADLGAGWKAERSNNKDQSNPRCSTYDPDNSDLVEVGDYGSPDFTRADGSFVSASTGVFRSVRGARTAFRRVAAPQLPGCFGELFLKQIKKPSTARVLSTGPLGFPKVGDSSSAYWIVMSLKSPTATVPFAVDMVLFNRRSVDVAMIFLGIGRPLPAALERALVARVASRVR